MNHAAVLHRPMSEYAFATDEKHLVFRLRCERDELKKVTFFYADRADMAPELTFFSLPMPRIRRDAVWDYYEVTLETDLERVAYYFLLEDERGACKYAGECFEKIDTHIERSEYFQYPFNHKADLAKTPDWVKDAVVYNIFPDSFADGKRRISKKGKKEKYLSAPSVTNHGGTICGISENLDYIKNLGCNCLYLNPVFAAGAYHKYDTLDYFHIDPCFGTDDDFKKFVQKAHGMGIRVIVDGVFNHVGANHPFFRDVLEKRKQSEYFDWFYSLPEDVVYPAEGEDPGYTCFAYVANMPKTNTSNDDMKAYFLSVGRHWIREYDVDGWRLDVANEVDDGFLRAFRRTVKKEKADALIIGEVWENAQHYMTGDMIDGAMNYDFRRFVTQYFAENLLSAEEFDVRLSSLLMRYKKQMLFSQLNLLDGHDTARFLSLLNGNTDKMELAILFQMTFVGMPCVFMGDEKGVMGISEAEYRKPMPWEKTHALEEIYRRLIDLRRNHEALRTGEFVTEETKGRALHYARIAGSERIDVFVNPGDETAEFEIPGEILLKKNEKCGLLMKEGYIVTRSENHAKHDL